MTSAVRVDPSLAVTILPGPPAAFGAVETPVVRAAPAGPTPFLLEGDRTAVTGTERGGAGAIRIDGRLVAADLVTDAGPAANVVVGPATLRRELLGHRGSVIENLLAVPALPIVAARWSAPVGGRESAGLAVEITLLPGERALRYRAGGSSLRADTGEADTVAAVVHPTPSDWSVREAEGGGIRARALVDAEGAVTLLVAAGSREQVGRALAAAPHLGSHEIRAAAATDPARMDTLVVRSGVGELDDGVAWATARVHAALRRTGTGDPEGIFWSGIGALAVGDTESAKRALALLDASGRPEPLAVLLAARYALASGDQGAAMDHLARLDPGAPERWRASGREEGSAWAAALGALADALHQAASPSELGALRAAASRAPAASGGGLRLPMAGDRGRGPSFWQGYLLRGLGALRPEAPPSAMLAPWVALREGRADAGYALWRRAVADGLAAGPAGRGSWDPAPASGPPAAAGAAALLATLAHGLLGIDPDAPSGRLRIAPALPAHLRSFAAHNIRLAEARVALEYRREERVHRYRLDPLGGRIPVMAVFEPSLPLRSVAAVRVDGSQADLELSTEGERTRLKVQLPLDRARELEVEGG